MQGLCRCWSGHKTVDGQTLLQHETAEFIEFLRKLIKSAAWFNGLRNPVMRVFAHASLNKRMSCDEFIFCLSGLWRGSLAHNDESYTPSFSSTKITAQAEMHLVHHAAQSVTIRIIYLWFLGGWHHIIYSLTAHHGWLVPDQLPASGPSDPSKVPLNDACKISLVKSKLILYINRWLTN